MDRDSHLECLLFCLDNIINLIILIEISEPSNGKMSEASVLGSSCSRIKYMDKGSGC